jgi:hypothetical protein
MPSLRVTAAVAGVETGPVGTAVYVEGAVDRGRAADDGRSIVIDGAGGAIAAGVDRDHDARSGVGGDCQDYQCGGNNECGFGFHMGIHCSISLTFMAAKYSKEEVRGPLVLLVLAALIGLSGCASVGSTSIYYLPMTGRVYPPKPKDAVIPILGRAPERKHTVIGRMAFSSAHGWKFMRQSLLYNARANGADAVILREADETREFGIGRVPPRVEWVPVPGPVYQTKKGRYYGGTRWIPFMRRGYTYPMTWRQMAVEAEMIVYR